MIAADLDSAEARIAHYEDEIFSWMREKIAAGHHAVSLAHDNIDDENSRLIRFDRDASALVGISDNGAVASSIIPFVDLAHMFVAGAEIVEIGAPPPQPSFWAAAAIVGEVGILAADYRGVGMLVGSKQVCSDSPLPMGRRFLNHVQRSGVTAARERANAAADTIAKQVKDWWR